MTNKKAKKRSLSESEVAVKVEVAKKNKKETEVAVQNGQAKKEGKPELAKKVNKQNKKSTENAAAKPTTQAVAKPKFKPNKELKAEEIKEKIRLIESRESLTKSAKRRLMGLKKLLTAAGGAVVTPAKSAVAQSSDNKKKKQVQSNEQQSTKVKPGNPAAQQKKANKKQNAKQGNLLLVKTQEKEAESDEDEDEDEEEEEEEKMDTTKEVDEDEDEDDEEVADDDDDEDEDGDDDDDDDDEDDDEEEDEDEEEVKVPAKPVAKAKAVPDVKKNKQTAEQTAKASEGGKKTRYVLFVGNLPYTVTIDEIKKHFLTKVSAVTSVRIPTKPGTNASRGFAYVELSNNEDYEKALSLHETFINGRRINVQYSTPGSKHAGNKREVIAKNQKLHALRKSGKLAGGRNNQNKKDFGKKGKQNAGGTKT